MNTPTPPTALPVEASPAAEPAGLSRWFSVEVAPHGAALKSYLRGAFPAVRDVEDVVQESFLRVWRARVRQPIRSSKSFLFQVARRIAIDLLRRERISPLAPACDTAAETVADERACGITLACARDEVELLVRAFDALPPRCREVLMLRKLDGLSYRDIALRLGITETAVEQAVTRGARRLEAHLAKYGTRPRGK